MNDDGSEITLRQATLADGDAIIALNTGSVDATSPMDMDEFRLLFELSSLTIVAQKNDQVSGFLMGFQDGADLDGANYQWFAERLKSFFYIDRIVIAAACRSSGLGQKMYAHVRAWAGAKGLHWLAAEMNLDPPNLQSLKFHKRNGFLEIGTQRLTGGKIVSMQIKRVARADPAGAKT